MTITFTPDRVACSEAHPSGLPPCVKIDYLVGFTLKATEWVCPDAPGEIGQKGRNWWAKRAGRVPGTVKEALLFANDIPIPERIKLEGFDEGVRILQYSYLSPDTGDVRNVDAYDSVFLTGEDRRLRELCSVECELVSQRGESGGNLVPAPTWWRNRLALSRWLTTISDAFDREALTHSDRETLRTVLEASRSLCRRNPSHMTFGQAGRNLAMAFNLKRPPISEELRLFFPSIWPPDDLVIQSHFDAFSRKLEAIVRDDWLGSVISPWLTYVRSLPEDKQGNFARSIGIPPTGQIHSGLVLAARGYLLEAVFIAGVSVEGFFGNRGPSIPSGLFENSVARGLLPFLSVLKEALREAVNGVRTDLGLPKIGEGWLSETDLFRRIQELLPDEEVIHHGRPKWLGRQHFDIWVRSRNIAIEYHGEQHYMAIQFFGGAAGLQRTRERDARKRKLAQENGTQLIEIPFNDILTDEWLKGRLLG